MKVFVVVLSVLAAVRCGPVSSEDSVLRAVVDNFVNCVNSDLSLCLKEHALKAAERLGTARKLQIIEGVTLLNNNPKEPKSLEVLATDPAVRSKQVSERLWESTSDLLQSSEIELSYGGNEKEESRSINDDAVEEGRGKKKKQIKKKLKLLIPLLILAKAKAVAIVVIALVVIAASIFKLALLAKIAFILKLIAIVKALLAKKHGQEEISYEAHGWEPHAEHAHVEHGHGWEGGWSRSRNEANNLAYSAYNK